MNDLIDKMNIEDAEVVENNRVDKEFEELTKQLAQQLRTAFCNRDQSQLYFVAKVSGRAHGDLEIEFEVGNAGYTQNVKGHSISAITTEFFRRKGFDNRYAPKALSYNGEEKT
jgi:hypothetical protein